MTTIRDKNEAQRGIALITSLLILLVMTTIGVSAIRTTTMEEKMAGNMRDHNLAFQSAESGLRGGEGMIASLNNTVGLDLMPGVYGIGDSEPGVTTLFDGTFWDSINSIEDSAGTPLDKLASQPRYLVKVVRCFRGTNQAANIGGYGNDKKKAKKYNNHLFRITARGTGGSDRSQVVLRSSFGIHNLDSPPGECTVPGYGV